MSAYDGMLKDQLRDLCMQRNLNVSGTNAELISRLEGWDAAHSDEEPDLLAEAGIEPPGDEPDPLPPVPEPAPKIIPNVREDPPGPEELPANQTVHRVRFEVPGNPNAVIPTELHQRFLRATEDSAIRAGHRIRGGACRVDFQTEGDKRYAVYEVILGRRVREVG